MTSPAGNFNKRFTILGKTEVVNSIGQPVPTYAFVGYVWGSLKPVSASQQYSAESVGHVLTHIVRARYTTLVVPECRLSWNDRTFHVNGVRNVDEEDAELDLTCTEVVK
jgi:SPP1 family predicted phage head-tail adaptor